MIVRRMNQLVALVGIYAILFVTRPVLCANQPPVADAGPSRYAGSEPIVLDGTGSYDPDTGDTLSYQWTQVSGPAVTLSDTNTATPTLQRTPDGTIHQVILSLTVTDNQQATSQDTVQVTIVSLPTNCDPCGLILQNSVYLEPFEAKKPTLVYFGGGHKDAWRPWAAHKGYFEEGYEWFPYVNVIIMERDTTVIDGPISNRDYYSIDAESYAERLIVYLSAVAPHYDQPIEMCGFSSGGVPAVFSAIYLNTQFQDPRYNVNQLSLLDAINACIHYDKPMSWNEALYTFKNSAVDGEPAFVAAYYATNPYDELATNEWSLHAINVAVDGGHSTPSAWYRGSINNGFGADVYNHGLVAGAFISVAGPGKNYNVPPDAAGKYHFDLQRDPITNAFLPLAFLNSEDFPGALPKPVTILGPADGVTVAVEGTTLGSEPSEHAVLYQLLVGEDKHNLGVVLEDDASFEIATGALPPNKIFFWTVKVFDRYGTTIHADPRSFETSAGMIGDLNNDAVLDNADCALLKAALGTTWGHSQFALSANLDGDQLITCSDAQIWLDLYREFLQNPAAPDPCGLEDTTDTDGDGIRDLCDNCPSIANAGQEDEDIDGLGDTCDNCWQEMNNNQRDNDGDSLGDLCDDDDDNDGQIDLDDNCPKLANPGWVNTDGDDYGDACDLCTDTDDDGFGDPGFPLNECLDDNCPSTANPDQLDTDGDGEGNACDSDMDDDGLLNSMDNCPMDVNPDQTDSDGDDVGDVCDNCPSVANTDQADLDEDGFGDVCDDDVDGDGVFNTADNCPTTPNPDQANADGDEYGDVCDIDQDGDGLWDVADNCPTIANPGQEDADNDGIGDVCDLCMDMDGDDYGDPGFPLNECPDDICPNVINPDQLDMDNDTFGDVCDNCPTVYNDDQADVLDGDGIGDVCDNCPNDFNHNQFDLDNDGLGDVCDDDRDGDGVLDTADNCLITPNPGQGDDDGDGVGNACDWCPETSTGLPVDAYGCQLPIPTLPGDFDGDDDIDLEDFGHFQVCIRGSGIIQTDTDCDPAHMDSDSDVDEIDLALFQSCMSGANIAGDASCAD